MSRLADILLRLPPNALVPAGWVLEHLAAKAEPPVPADAPDLSVVAFARLIGRSEATVRAWCGRSAIPGAYKLPGDRRRAAWRIPAASVVAFRERLKAPPLSAVAAATDPEPRGGADITAWRTLRPRSRRAA